MRTYKGFVKGLKPNEYFVFGSNPEGRHGAGAALCAKMHFGAIHGQGFGFQGQSYAIATKDLRKREHPSISVNDIKTQIETLYIIARLLPKCNFYIAYTGNGTNLNGYSNMEMAEMFSGNVPENIVFEEEFNKLVRYV